MWKTQHFPKNAASYKYTKAGLGVGCPSWKIQWQVHAITTYYLKLPRQSDPWREIQASTCLFQTMHWFILCSWRTRNPFFCHWTIPTKFLVLLDLHRETVLTCFNGLHEILRSRNCCFKATYLRNIYFSRCAGWVQKVYGIFWKSLHFCFIFSAPLVRGCHWPYRRCSRDVHPLNFILVHRSIMLQAVLQRGYLQVSLCTVVPGFSVLCPSPQKGALNPGSALNPGKSIT